MRKASELAGTDFNTLVKTFPMLANNINLASTGTGKAAEAFKKLGVSATNSDGSLRASDQVLLDIADKFKGMEDGVNKASIAYDIFGGKTGEQLIPLLNNGRESIEGMSTAMTEHGVKRMAAFNDSITSLQHTFGDLFVKLTDALLPALEKFVGALTFLIEKFVGLPSPVQAVIASLGILVPLVVTIVPLLGAMAISIKAIAAIKLGAMFTAATPAITGLAVAFAPFLIKGAVVVGLIALGKLIGTVAGHLWAAKDRIGEGITAIGDFFNAWKESVGMIMQAIGDKIREPFKRFKEFVSNAFTGAVDGIRNAFQSIPDFVKSIINAATAPIRTFMNTIKKALTALRNLLRRRAAASSSSSNEGSPPPTPRAKGGLITSPEVAYIGEQGNEYIIPARKAGAFSRNYLAGMRGSAAIPRFAEGGFTGTPNVNITTGAVTQMDGTNFVTTKDLVSAVQSGIDQTLGLIQSDLRTRQLLGLT